MQDKILSPMVQKVIFHKKSTYNSCILRRRYEFTAMPTIYSLHARLCHAVFSFFCINISSAIWRNKPRIETK